MKTEKNILIAFILNLLFSLFELFGGIFTNSISITSDAFHDFCDSISIGLSFFLEKKSKSKPNNIYTYGYTRYSVLGALITTTILITGAVIAIYNSIKRIINPVSINYDGMIFLALIGVCVNMLAAYFTKEGHSLNQKSVNLHMIEDVLGWIIVLIGSIIIKFTEITLIDSFMSIIVSTFILIKSIKNLKSILNIFLEKKPDDIIVENIKEAILKIDGVIDIHHVHIWSIDGFNNYATMHIVTENNNCLIKDKIRKLLLNEKISHVTIEIEDKSETCKQKDCSIKHICNHHH